MYQCPMCKSEFPDNFPLEEHLYKLKCYKCGKEICGKCSSGIFSKEEREIVNYCWECMRKEKTNG